MKKVSEKEKLYRKVIAYVEKLVAEGTVLTNARNAAAVKFGMAEGTVRRMTMHLSTRNR